MFNYLKKKNLKKAYLKSISFSFQKKIIHLVPVGNWILKSNKIIKSINKHRLINNKCFIDEIDNNLNKTRKYFKKIINDKEMCLFMISSSSKRFYGVIGLKKIKNSFEVYFVLKLRKNNLFNVSLKKMISWANINFKIKKFIVSVFSNNYRAKKLYFNCGFRNKSKVYLKKIKKNGLNNHIFVPKKLSNVSYFYQTLKLKL